MSSLTVIPPVTGTITRVVGAEVEVRGLRLAVGANVTLDGLDGPLSAEVIAVG